MAIYVKSNAQGGGIVTESGSEQGIHLNNDNSWYIETKSISYVDQTPCAVRAFTEVIDGYPPRFVVYNYTGNLDSSANLSSFIGLGFGHVSLGADSLVDNGNRVQPRISLDAAGASNLSLEVEHNQSATYTNGIYINCSDEENAGISFRDYTIDPESPSKKYFLKDFVLKTDIPAGVDLANYTGEVNLSEQKSFTFGGSTFNRSSIFSLASFDKDLFPDIPEEYSEYIKGPYISYTLDIESDIQGQTVLAFAGEPGFYTKTPSGSAFLSLANKASLVYNQYFENKQQRSAEVYAGQRTSGVYSVFLNAYGFSDSAGTAGFAQIEVYAYGSNQGIEFRQNNLNNGQPITLESILNRIAQLESTVAELQTQLAAKANTASPTFTGKASISNQ